MLAAGAARRHARDAPAKAPAVVAAQRPAADAKLPQGTVGWIDTPAAEAVVADSVRVSGWALDPGGIDRVEIRVDGRTMQARYGLARPDIAQAKPGYPDAVRAGFDYTVSLDDASLQRHRIEVVAVNRAGVATVLGRKSLVPPRALALWEGGQPRAGDPAFAFLMALSAIPQGGALEADTMYAPYLRSTPRVGIAVPILYLRTTTGPSGDWNFDPAFDLTPQVRQSPRRRGQPEDGDRLVRRASHSRAVHPQRRHLGRRELRFARVGHQRPAGEGHRQLPVDAERTPCSPTTT